MAKAQVSPAGDVAELVISAPPLNLFDGQLITDLETALDELGGCRCPRSPWCTR